MSKIVATTFVSLDGVMQEPRWSFKYWGDDIANYKFTELMQSDAQLLGRVTWEGFAQAWPDRKDEQGYADKFNSMPKYVVSDTLQEAGWTNSHIVRGSNLVSRVNELRAAPGGDILISGSATLINTLLKHNLVDEYKLLTYPIVLGAGKRIFFDGSSVNLKLTNSIPFKSGAIALIYQPE